LCRVFEFARDPRLYVLKGAIKDHYRLASAPFERVNPLAVILQHQVPVSIPDRDLSRETLDLSASAR